MKKLKKYLIVVLILTIFFSAIFNYNVSIADVGNFEDYDSGSSWDDDSWDSESSWNDWDDDDYSYSGTSYSSGGSSPLVSIITVIIIFIIAGAIASSNNKKSTKNRHIPSIYDEFDSSEENVERKIKAVDEMFNKEEFSAWTRSLFMKLQEAWTARDWSTIRVFETNELFEQHKTQLQGYINNGTINVMDRICVNYAKLNKFYQTSDKDILKIALNSSMVDYIKDEKTGNVLKGNTETRLTHTYILTFVRKRGVLTQAGGPKVASANCPNCGAPTKVALAGKCEYCGSLIKIEDHGWVLSNLERM